MITTDDGPDPIMALCEAFADREDGRMRAIGERIIESDASAVGIFEGMLSSLIRDPTYCRDLAHRVESRIIAGDRRPRTAVLAGKLLACSALRKRFAFAAAEAEWCERIGVKPSDLPRETDDVAVRNAIAHIQFAIDNADSRESRDLFVSALADILYDLHDDAGLQNVMRQEIACGGQRYYSRALVLTASVLDQNGRKSDADELWRYAVENDSEGDNGAPGHITATACVRDARWALDHDDAEAALAAFEKLAQTGPCCHLRSGLVGLGVGRDLVRRGYAHEVAGACKRIRERWGDVRELVELLAEASAAPS